MAAAEKRFHVFLAQMYVMGRDADGDGDLAGLELPGDGLVAHDADRLAGDHARGIGGDDEHLDPGIGVRDVDHACRIFACGPILDRIYEDAQLPELLAGHGADAGGVFADASGKDQHVQPAQHGIVGADIFAQPIGKNLGGQHGLAVPGVGRGGDLAGITGQPREPFQAALAVEQVIDLVGRKPLAHEVGDDGRVDVAGAGNHHQAFQGGEAHAGVDGAAVIDGADRGPFSQVTGNNLEPGKALFHVGGGHKADVLV